MDARPNDPITTSGSLGDHSDVPFFHPLRVWDLKVHWYLQVGRIRPQARLQLQLLYRGSSPCINIRGPPSGAYLFQQGFIAWASIQGAWCGTVCCQVACLSFGYPLTYLGHRRRHPMYNGSRGKTLDTPHVWFASILARLHMGVSRNQGPLSGVKP